MKKAGKAPAGAPPAVNRTVVATGMIAATGGMLGRRANDTCRCRPCRRAATRLKCQNAAGAVNCLIRQVVWPEGASALPRKAKPPSAAHPSTRTPRFLSHMRQLFARSREGHHLRLLPMGASSIQPGARRLTPAPKARRSSTRTRRNIACTCTRTGSSRLRVPILSWQSAPGSPSIAAAFTRAASSRPLRPLRLCVNRRHPCGIDSQPPTAGLPSRHNFFTRLNRIGRSPV